MKAHRITEDFATFMEGRKPGDAITLAMIYPAHKKDVDTVLMSSPKTGEGRSPWVWVRLPNGDLLLGVFPQGDMYCAMEEAAQFPEPEEPESSSTYTRTEDFDDIDKAFL